MADQKCRGCGCTEANCSGCVAKTGEPCFWVQPDLCSACAPPAELEEAAVEVVSAQLREALKESFIGEENMTPEAKAKMLAVVKERLAEMQEPVAPASELEPIPWVTLGEVEVDKEDPSRVHVTFEFPHGILERFLPREPALHHVGEYPETKINWPTVAELEAIRNRPADPAPPVAGKGEYVGMRLGRVEVAPEMAAMMADLSDQASGNELLRGLAELSGDAALLAMAEAGGIAWVTSRNYEVTSDGSITVEPVTFEYGGPDAPEFQNQYMQKPIPPRKPG